MPKGEADIRHFEQMSIEGPIQRIQQSLSVSIPHRLQDCIHEFATQNGSLHESSAHLAVKAAEATFNDLPNLERDVYFCSFDQPPTGCTLDQVSFLLEEPQHLQSKEGIPLAAAV